MTRPTEFEIDRMLQALVDLGEAAEAGLPLPVWMPPQPPIRINVDRVREGNVILLRPR